VDRFQEALEMIDPLLRGETFSFRGRYYQLGETTLAPRPLQLPRPPLTIAASGSRMVKLAARYADSWVTEGNHRELWRHGVTAQEVQRLNHERNEQLSEQAAAQGRDPSAISRAFLAGYGPSPERPWASVEAFQDLIGRYREIGFNEFLFPEPAGAEHEVFERVMQEVVPRLRSSSRSE
jgi:alkanesulfonate monooxygenase SsuD/methylene tetrahydromethanopterin reductase-like flavin-dependent oxidoreductase (luciferase family)